MSISNLRDPTIRQSLGVASLNTAGIATNLTWTSSGGAGLYTASIAVNGVTATSVVTATIQAGADGDVLNAWLAKAVPATNAINFYLASNPARPQELVISWQVTQAYNPPQQLQQA